MQPIAHNRKRKRLIYLFFSRIIFVRVFLQNIKTRKEPSICGFLPYLVLKISIGTLRNSIETINILVATDCAICNNCTTITGK